MRSSRPFATSWERLAEKAQRRSGATALAVGWGRAAERVALLARGSRLRLVVTCPNSIYLEENYATGGVVALESGANAQPIHVTLYHDRQHLSGLEMPSPHAHSTKPSTPESVTR